MVLAIFLPKIIGGLLELNSLNMQQEATEAAMKYRNSPDCSIFSDQERDECYLTHAINTALREQVDSGDCSKIISEVTKSQCEEYVLGL